MSFVENTMNNNALSALTQKAAPQIISAIKKASAATGVNFAYLVEQAQAESAFDSCAQSKSSSACGLYQFIESTWMDMVEKHGDKYGLGDFAAAIKNGDYKNDPALKQNILALREDPEISALLAGEFAAGNEDYMTRQGIEDIGPVELYFAHFMGAGGATAFLKAKDEDPLATAADLFPAAARANRNVFYDSQTGEARSLSGVYDFFAQKFGVSQAEENSVATPQIAAAPTSAAPAPLPALHNTLSPFMGQTAFDLLGTQSGTDISQFMPRAGLLHNPIDLMLLAQLELPLAHQK